MRVFLGLSLHSWVKERWLITVENEPVTSHAYSCEGTQAKHAAKARGIMKHVMSFMKLRNASYTHS